MPLLFADAAICHTLDAAIFSILYDDICFSLLHFSMMLLLRFHCYFDAAITPLRLCWLFATLLLLLRCALLLRFFAADVELLLLLRAPFAGCWRRARAAASYSATLSHCHAAPCHTFSPWLTYYTPLLSMSELDIDIITIDITPLPAHTNDAVARHAIVIVIRRAMLRYFSLPPCCSVTMLAIIDTSYDAVTLR